MGASCCGGGGRIRRKARSRIVHSATTEPLLRESEREAVSNLLKYLEEGSVRLMLNCPFSQLMYNSSKGI